MPDNLYSVVGSTSVADGSKPLGPRVDKQGSAVHTAAHGKYTEAASRGVLFSACEQGSGVAPVAAISTTATLCLYNPSGSAVRLAIKKVSLGYFSGTLGAGTHYHCINTSKTQTAPSSGTLLVNACNDVGNPAAGNGVARVGATVVAPVAYRPFMTVGAQTAAITFAPQLATDDLDGEIVLEPGTSYQLQGVTAAGSSPKVTAGIVWEEIPIV